MNVLIVYAHPEPRSLNGSLKDFAVQVLTEAGHTVKVSDLYAMQWKAAADGYDFLDYRPEERLIYAAASKAAYREGRQLPEIAAEQEKLLWADAVIFQFPLWWFSMPAIMKGWIERIYAYGLAYGVGRHEGKYWGLRYGEGKLAGKRGLLAVTAGGREPQYGKAGVNGYIDDLLFPINHGVLWYTGMAALPPFVLYQVDRLTPEQYEQATAAYRERLLHLFDTPAIPYRMQNGGDYDDQQVLLPELADGKSGLALHLLGNE